MNKSIFKHAVGNADNIQIRTLSDATTARMMGLDIKDLPEMRSISCRFLSKTYHGVGVINQNNGIEFINQDLMDSPVTLSNTGITFLPLNKETRSSK